MRLLFEDMSDILGKVNFFGFFWSTDNGQQSTDFGYALFGQRSTVNRQQTLGMLADS